MRIGIAFDLAPTAPAVPDEAATDDRFEEFDSRETVDAVASALRRRGHDVTLLGDGPALLRSVLADPPDLVWNMAEGEGVGRCREARVPAALEMLGIPCTGSDALTLAATLDKDVARRLVASTGRVSVPLGVTAGPGLGEDDFGRRLAAAFPAGCGRLLLKPNLEGSSKGIRGDCLCDGPAQAWAIYRRISRDYGQATLIEEFIEGDELTVGLLGTGEILGAMRISPADPIDGFVYSLEVKRDWRRRVVYEAPARLSAVRDARLRVASVEAYRVLGCRDLARIDFRFRDDEPYFLEANPLPGLSPVTSDLVILSRGHGIDYDDLIGRILLASLARLGLDERPGR